jgi:Protein of unknown function (DUF1501)
MLTRAGRSKGRFCDGVFRRDFLRIGGLAFGGLTMPQLLRAEGSAGMGLSHKAVIMVFLAGGPPHQDMFDLKPDAPAGIRGEFRPIATDVPGLAICEHMPRLAAMMSKFVVIRSLVGAGPEHAAGLCLTGYKDLVSRAQGGRPSLGAVVSELQGPFVQSRHPPICGAVSQDRSSAVGKPWETGLAHGTRMVDGALEGGEAPAGGSGPKPAPHRILPLHRRSLRHPGGEGVPVVRPPLSFHEPPGYLGLAFQNVFATLYHNLGIDPATTVADREGRPMALLDEREPIRELI